MFDNIGSKIKNLAQGVCFIGIACSVICGISFLAIDEDLFLVGLLVAVIGALCSWLGTFLLYGFGELIERVTSIDEKMKGSTPPVYEEPSTFYVRTPAPAPSVPDPRPAASSSSPALDKVWYCGYCGTQNTNISAQCKGCGRYKLT